MILAFNFNVLAVSDQTLRIIPVQSDRDTPIYNDWFVYNLDDGESMTDRIEVINLTPYEMEVLVYPADIIKKNGDMILKKDDDTESISNWITIDPMFQKFSILPGENVFVPFNINMPDNVEDAEYIGAVVVEPTHSYLGHNVTYKTRLAVRVYEYNGVDSEMLSFVNNQPDLSNEKVSDPDSWASIASEINRLNNVINFLFVTILIILVAVVLAVFAPFIEKHKKHGGG